MESKVKKSKNGLVGRRSSGEGLGLPKERLVRRDDFEKKEKRNINITSQLLEKERFKHRTNQPNPKYGGIERNRG